MLKKTTRRRGFAGAKYCEADFLRRLSGRVTEADLARVYEAMSQYPSASAPSLFSQADAPNVKVFATLLKTYSFTGEGVYAHWSGVSRELFGHTIGDLEQAFHDFRRAGLVYLGHRKPPGPHFKEIAVRLTNDARAFVKDRGLQHG